MGWGTAQRGCTELFWGIMEVGGLEGRRSLECRGLWEEQRAAEDGWAVEVRRGWGRGDGR